MKQLYDAFLPGPLTIILKANDQVPRWINSGLATVGFRLPNHPVTRELIQAEEDVYKRQGMRRKAYPIGNDTDIFDYIDDISPRPYCVLIDEAQFLTRANVYDLARIVDELDIPVMAFGLKNDFQNNLFEGSKYLLLLSDKIEEIKTICHYCSRKATMVLRMEDGEPVYEGVQVQIGGHESYISVCRKHWFNPPRERIVPLKQN